jgi:GDP/UDP-N,N'-diacetylbacillosamine 2-epimerase (hydrolysing)
MIEKYCKNNPKLIAYKNLGRGAFINLMRGASCLLGNSSMGMLETSSLGLPTLNIGSRQVGRLHGDNVVFVPCSLTAVSKGLDKCLNDQNFIRCVKNAKNPYGDGRSAAKIARILKTMPLSSKLIYKNITY